MPTSKKPKQKSSKRKSKPKRAPAGLVRETAAEYRVASRLSATEAARNLSELLNRARYRGESFIIERGGEPICELRPIQPSPFTGADLVALLRSLPPIDEDYLETVELLQNEQPSLPESPWEE